MISYSELNQRLRASTKPTLAILPTGCYEQHGPVLPLDTDNIIAQSAAERLAKALDDRYESHLFPLLPYSTTEPNLNYTGTISVAADPFRAYLQQIVKGILMSPFDAVLILNSHGSVVGSLKEVAFGMVLEQYRDPSVSKVRPVLALNVFDYDSGIAEIMEQPVGRHADWKEFLLTYEILGETYYTEERLARLRAFRDNNSFDQTMPKVIGIPAEYRTTDGVQGQPLPRDGNYQKDARKVWDFTIQNLQTTVHEELLSFRDRYSSKRSFRT